MDVRLLFILAFSVPLISGQLTFIDSFEEGIVNAPGVVVAAGGTIQTDTGVQVGSFTQMMGGERFVEIAALKVDPGGPDGSAKTLISGTCANSADSNVFGAWTFTWDGPAAIGLGGLDFFAMMGCPPGLGEPAVFVTYDDQDHCHDVELELFDGTGSNSVLKPSPFFDYMGTCVELAGTVRFDFVEFAGTDFSDIEAVILEIDALGQGVDALDSVFDYIALGCCELDPECDDGDACTDDTCVNHKCVNTENWSTRCDDSDLCTDDSCDPVDGTCGNDENWTVRCDDSSLCTDDTCDVATGNCDNADNWSIRCDDSTACTDDSCDPADGSCSNDENWSVRCNDIDACTDDSCDPADGTCSNDDNWSVRCDDSDACTDDTCDPVDGNCGNDENWSVRCDDSSLCTDDSCNVADGTCNNDENYSVRCDDTDVCTDDICIDATGACNNVDSWSLRCNDDDLCTDDSCDAGDGTCINTENWTGRCDDSDACSDDTCDPVDGSCINTENWTVRCDDSDACTDDSCDVADGSCQNDENWTVRCDDSDLCTDDSCDVADGTCQNDENWTVRCDDIDTCTDDSCDPADGTCDHIDNWVVRCDDSDVCTDDSCDTLALPDDCVNVAAPIVDDGNDCTDDTCDDATGDPITGEVHTHICGPQCTEDVLSVVPYYNENPATAFSADVILTHDDPTATMTPIFTVTPAAITPDVIITTIDGLTYSVYYECNIPGLVDPVDVTIDVDVTDNYGAPTTCQLVFTCEEEPGCPESCDEEMKTAICYPDEDGHLNKICVLWEDLTTYFENGGFILDPKLMPYDCACQPVVPSPTNVPTMYPTDFPTESPTEAPTPDPTDAPTEAPTDSPTDSPTAEPTEAPTDAPIPTNAPTEEVCMDTVDDMPGFNYRCIIDSHGNVDMGILNLTDTEKLDWMIMEGGGYFPLGSYYDQFDENSPDIWWDCWCHAECPEDHYMIPVLLDDSEFYDNVLSLYVAIPDKFSLAEFHFETADGTSIPEFDCITIIDQETDVGCTYWETGLSGSDTENWFRHNCYQMFVIHVPFDMIAPYYDDPHEEGVRGDGDGWTVTYFGNLVGTALQDLDANVRGVDNDFIFRSNFRWSVTFPLEIAAHAEDLRIYDEINKLDEVVFAGVYSEDFDWGFGYGDMENIWGELVIYTSVQWPFVLDLVAFTARTFPTDLIVSWREVDNTNCQDPGIVEYEDEAWEESAESNPVNNVPMPCDQYWLLEIEPKNGICTLDDFYDLSFEVSCQPSYEDNCPIDERYDAPLMCEFWLTTENFCDVFETTVTVGATMDSFECPERTCDCEEENFIQNFEYDGELFDEMVFFEINIDSSEPLMATEIYEIETELVCQDSAEPMKTVYNFDEFPMWADDVYGYIYNYPITPESQCGGDLAANTINFEFDLSNDFFSIPFDDSCELRVWVVVDLFYRGVTRPDGRIAMMGDPSLLLLEAESDGTAAFGESRWIRVEQTLQIGESRGATVQINADVDVDANDVADVVDEVPSYGGAYRAGAVPAVVFSLMLLVLNWM